QWYERAMEILEFVGLAEFKDRRAGFLSGGMKQKLGLATALVHRPRVLLLDEPTGGVDPVTRQDFWQLIIRFVTTPTPPSPPARGGEPVDSPPFTGGLGGVSVLVSTPYMDEAVRCTYVGFMRDGRLVVEDKPKVLRQRLEGRIVELRGEPLTKLRALAGADENVESVQTFGDRLHLRIQEGSSGAVIANLKNKAQQQGLDIHKIEIISPGLEDVFIALLEDA
ncbi:MAG: ABC transporter ATP-binding protein, partial [Anaerolineales bacterium]|nr:ABC transporter ATP-binding protein [Anaerolineales bacterium]